MMVLLVVVLVGTLAVALGAALAVVRGQVEEEAEARALTIARAVAADPRYAPWVVAGRPSSSGPVRAAAEAVRVRTGALYVVVADRAALRYSHPEVAKIGRPVSTDLAHVLRGHDETLIEQGTLGVSARGKTPLRAADGRIVGAVSVGVPIAQVDALQRRMAQVFGLIGLVSLLAGLPALALYWRRLRRSTHGLEPEELADLLREHAAVLGGVRDGVVAVDPAGTVRLCNAAASLYLQLPDGDSPRGRAAAQVLPPALAGMLAQSRADVDEAPTGSLVIPSSAWARGSAFADQGRGRVEEGGRLVVHAGRVLDVRLLPVVRDGRDLGTVFVLRDRTDLDDLGRELEVTRALTDALRAQTHEHSNRLHALAGMLHLGHVEEASDYLADLSGASAWSGDLADPYLAGLLAAKTAAAAERGVSLRVGEETWVDAPISHPLACVTVIGNLVDNAIRAAEQGSRRPAWVEVSLLRAGVAEQDLLAHVVDSGDGVRPGEAEAIFADGWTTKADRDRRHGVGLALARVSARRHGGDVRLVSAGSAADAGHGAAFEATLADAFPADHGDAASPPTGEELT